MLEFAFDMEESCNSLEDRFVGKAMVANKNGYLADMLFHTKEGSVAVC